MSQDIERQYGNVMVSTFRKIYGDDFAKDVGPTTKLSVALETLDSGSKSKLQKDADEGTLQDKISENL